jgi:archaemetzincin
MPLQWSSEATFGRREMLTLAASLPVLALTACSRRDTAQVAVTRLRRLARRKLPPQPGDWLETHQDPGQTYQQFRQAVKTPAIQTYSTLRIVPIGPLSEGQQVVMNVVRDFLSAFFGLTLADDPPVELESIPADARRVHFMPGETHQLLTRYLLNESLMARRQPLDAAVLGITASDLWPGDGWNFVFGQASLKERVGVWSMARNGDADSSLEERQLCALRTTMTATHETGHMFGIRHCIAYECGMNGSNNAAERDRQPLEFCPECQPKLWWTLGLDPVKRSRDLEAVARKHGFLETATGFAAQSAALSR